MTDREDGNDSTVQGDASMGSDVPDERDAPQKSADPGAIRSVAVHVEDVVTALEARARGGRETALRLTPPFSGRMRARIHVVGSAATTDPDAITLPPARFVDEVPPYPSVDETEDELRARGAYTREKHRDRHADAVDDWRAAVRDRIVDNLPLQAGGDPHEVEVKPLG